MLLFNISTEAESQIINAVDMDPLQYAETSHIIPISRKSYQKMTRFQIAMYRLNRLLIGIFGYLLVKYNVVVRAVIDYNNGDEWWCFFGLACLVMPSIPVAIKHLQRMINDVNTGRETNKVKPFFKLLCITIVYICGGFILFTIYRICYKIYCTCQNIKDPMGKRNEMKYRRKEVELNLTQAVLESAPDGLLMVYRLLKYNGDLTLFKSHLFHVYLGMDKVSILLFDILI